MMLFGMMRDSVQRQIRVMLNSTPAGAVESQTQSESQIQIDEKNQGGKRAQNPTPQTKGSLPTYGYTPLELVQLTAELKKVIQAVSMAVPGVPPSGINDGPGEVEDKADIPPMILCS
jgi:predicted component of type VI protein secretion system